MTSNQSVGNNPRIVTVGAYERDNFGDLLFWHAARHFAGDNTILPASPFPGASTSLLGIPVDTYADVMTRHPGAPVWVVGGEVGGTTLEKAAASHPLADQHGVAAAVEASRLPEHASPYMPRHFPHALVMNSIGVDGVRRLHGNRLGYAVNSLRSASYLGVREAASAETLRRLGIRHTMAPDAVHTLKLWHEPKRLVSDYIVFQMKGSLLKRENFADLASQILKATADDERIILFAAGLASGHDSLEGYEQLAETIGRLSPETRVSIHTDIDPIGKVDIIANARLWIGTSLHGLIITNTLAVPNVALEIRKLQIYSNTWGLAMPVDVSLRELENASHAARSERRIERAQSLAVQLQERSRASMERTVSTLLEDADKPLRGQVAPGMLQTLTHSVVSRARILK